MTKELVKMIKKLCSVLEIILPHNFLKEFVKTDSRELGIFNFGLGLYLKNNILTHDSALFEEFKKYGINEKDNMSGILIKEFYEYLYRCKKAKIYFVADNTFKDN